MLSINQSIIILIFSTIRMFIFLAKQQPFYFRHIKNTPSALSFIVDKSARWQMHLRFDPAIPLLGFCPTNVMSKLWKDICQGYKYMFNIFCYLGIVGQQFSMGIEAENYKAPWSFSLEVTGHQSCSILLIMQVTRPAQTQGVEK